VRKLKNNETQKENLEDPKKTALHYMTTLVEVAREAFLIMDADLRVISANDVFYHIFRVEPSQTEGKLLYELGNGQWDIPEFRRLLEEILPLKKVVKDFEVKHIFETIGKKTIELNARQIDTVQLIILALEDITESKNIAEKFEEYTDGQMSAWNTVEEPTIKRALTRCLKDRFAWLRNSDNRLIPAITTTLGPMIPDDYRVLDLGTATGHVPKMMIEIGVKPENIVGVDINHDMLSVASFPNGVNKVCANATKLEEALKKQLSGFGNFDLVIVNMMFHLLSYKDYVAVLRQIRKVVTDRADLYTMVPHPVRDYMNSIPGYDRRRMVEERAPWGDTVEYRVKPISDYARGLHQAGFRGWAMGTAGLDVRPEHKIILDDETAWERIHSSKTRYDGGKLPRHFRLWHLAYPA